MNDQEVAELITKYNEGTLSAEEKAMLDTWYLKYAAESKAELSAETEGTLMSRLRAELPLAHIATRRLWPRVAIAAAVALIILGVYFFNYNNKQQIGITDFATQDIAPGKQGATLTLASGKKIRLSDAANGEIVRESGISVTKTVDGQLVYEVKEGKGNPNRINTLSTDKGETYIVTLPDKSKVWLNAASSLTYTAGLNELGKRKVKLEGEAYFEVAKDKAHPFIVESRGQNIEVLGTHFNVNSYAEEKAVATTLLEGSVQVTSGNFKQLLKPGQQALNNGKSIQVSMANIAQVTDWKEGDFNLDHIDFKAAMRKIARWYDVEVVYDVSISDDIETGGWIPRNNNLSEVLKALEGTGIAKFSVKGRTVYVNKN